ncbi:PPC domain-containing protein [Microcoleus sp. ARI1-B5]|uniref:PPC domain-containing protein n=1 Tax=unclassified Microcoleus TaxID=2642155 RepID=UPI002FD61C31
MKTLPLGLTLISAVITAITPVVLAQPQPPANEIYIDKNCRRNQQLPQLERLTIFSRNEFITNSQKYWFYAARNLDGSALFCISQPNFNQPKVLNAEKIQRQFIDKVIPDPNKKTAFIIAVRGGNGPEAPVTNFGLDLSNVDRPKLTPLSILQQRGALKDGDPTLSNGSLSREHSFQGRAGQSVTIDLKSRSFDHFITLIAPSGDKISDIKPVRVNGRESQIIVKLPSNGTYKIVVQGLDRTSKGSYTLSINSNQL